jgi:hypothetical protein
MQDISGTPPVEGLAPVTAGARTALAMLAIGVAISIVAIAIGDRRIDLGLFTIVLFPIIFAFLFSVGANRLLARRDAAERFPAAASGFVGILVMLLVIKYGLLIGTQVEKLLSYGSALILQELGNLGTLLFGMPLAVLALRMGREAIGATFSIGREPNIAIIANRYGISGPEGLGVLGVYVIGSLVGSLFFSVFPLAVASLSWFRLDALAMACGVGSASMTAACSAALTVQFPDRASDIDFLAGASNLFSNFIGFYICIFLALPLAEWLFRRFSRLVRSDADLTAAAPLEKPIPQAPSIAGVGGQMALLLASVLLCLLCQCLLSGRLAAPMLSTGAAMLAAGALAILASALLPRIDAIISASLISIALSLGLRALGMAEGLDGISIIAIATPILGFSGMALRRADFAQVARTGHKLMLVALFVFSGTYVASAVIANVILDISGQ